jgi:hypothetical protein
MRAKIIYICKKFINHQIKKCLLFRYRHAVVKAWFHERFFSAKCELFRLFLLYCDYSNKLFLLDCSQFKRNRRNISHFAEKKCPWNQAFIMQTLNWTNQCPLFMTVRHIFEISEDDHPPVNSNKTGTITRPPSLKPNQRLDTIKMWHSAKIMSEIFL